MHNTIWEYLIATIIGVGFALIFVIALIAVGGPSINIGEKEEGE